MEAVERYPEQVRKQGGDATVCPEFIALHEIRRAEQSEDLIRAAYEKAIQAATGALRDADTKQPETQSARSQALATRSGRRPSWVVPVVAWLVVAGISIWLEDEGTSPVLLASIVASTAYLLGVGIKLRRNKDREQGVDPNA
jgi:Flp pilus assembly protein TadB